MENNKKEEMKSIVEQLIDSLSKQGVKVDGAAIINLPDLEGREDIVDQTIKNVFSKMRKMGFQGIPNSNPIVDSTQTVENFNQDQTQADAQKELTKLGNENSDKSGQCYCPDCFSFDSFEEVLDKRGGTFDYAAVQLGDKVFQIKYWTNGKDENIMISPEKYQIDPSWTLEMCQEALNVAISKKDYETGQTILNRINELKNQNKGGQ